MKRIKSFQDHVSEKKEAKPKKPKKERQPQWWDKFTKYELSAYPVNIPEEDVTVDLSGDIDTHPVLTWNSPKTGKKVYSYTKKRMEAQKAQKYERISNLSDKQIEQIKVKCHEDIVLDEASDSDKQAAAVVSIIAQTGLRPGSREGFEKTENRGVLTLGPDNVKINGDKIQLEFVGKSYKENVAEFEDGALAHYLQNRIKEQRGEEFLFDISKSTVDQYYKDKLKMEGFKIKDLRTFIANKLAKIFLNSSEAPPPPVPEKPAEIKKAVKSKLKRVFEYVSKMLNNSPAMARNSYVDPGVIDSWLNKLGIRSVITEDAEQPEGSEPEKFIGNAPVYALPKWWDDEDAELVKDK